MNKKETLIYNIANFYKIQLEGLENYGFKNRIYFSSINKGFLEIYSQNKLLN